MGSSTMAFNKILVCTLIGVVAGQASRTLSVLNGNSLNNINTPPTPVPILKFIDEHNTDGSYTYGFEGADGTYKLETRLATGEVQGKYGYIDSNGVLRETVYGADIERGFVPVLDGVEIPAPSVEQKFVQKNKFVPTSPPAPSVNPNFNQIFNFGEVSRSSRPANQLSINQQANRQPFKGQNTVKIINGRRAVLRKRPRSKKVADSSRNINVALTPQLSRQEQLEERQRQLQLLEDQRVALHRLQQAQARPAPARSESPRSFSGFKPQQFSPNFQPLSNP